MPDLLDFSLDPGAESAAESLGDHKPHCVVSGQGPPPSVYIGPVNDHRPQQGLDHNYIGMKCLGEVQLAYDMKANERWVLFSKDTFQEIFNATLHEMTKTSHGGEEEKNVSEKKASSSVVSIKREQRRSSTEARYGPQVGASPPRRPQDGAKVPRSQLQTGSKRDLQGRPVLSGRLPHVNSMPEPSHACTCPGLQQPNWYPSSNLHGHGGRGHRLPVGMPPVTGIQRLCSSPQYASALLGVGDHRDSELPLDLSYKRSDDEGETPPGSRDGGEPPVPSVSPVSTLGSPASSSCSYSGRESPEYIQYMSQTNDKMFPENRTRFKEASPPPTRLSAAASPTTTASVLTDPHYMSRGTMSKHSVAATSGRIDRLAESGTSRPTYIKPPSAVSDYESRPANMKRGGGGVDWAPFSKATLCNLVDQVMAGMEDRENDESKIADNKQDTSSSDNMDTDSEIEPGCYSRPGSQPSSPDSDQQSLASGTGQQKDDHSLDSRKKKSGDGVLADLVQDNVCKSPPSTTNTPPPSVSDHQQNSGKASGQLLKDDHCLETKKANGGVLMDLIREKVSNKQPCIVSSVNVTAKSSSSTTTVRERSSASPPQASRPTNRPAEEKPQPAVCRQADNAARCALRKSPSPPRGRASTPNPRRSPPQCWVALNKMMVMDLVDSNMRESAGGDTVNGIHGTTNNKQNVSNVVSSNLENSLESSSSSASPTHSGLQDPVSHSIPDLKASNQMSQPEILNNNNNTISAKSGGHKQYSVGSVEPKELLRQKLTAMESHSTSFNGSRPNKRCLGNKDGGPENSSGSKKRKGKRGNPMQCPSPTPKSQRNSPGPQSVDMKSVKTFDRQQSEDSELAELSQVTDHNKNVSVSSMIIDGRSNSPQYVQACSPKGTNSSRRNMDVSAEESRKRASPSHPCLVYSSDSTVTYLGASQSNSIDNDDNNERNQSVVATPADIKDMHPSAPFNIGSRCLGTDNNKFAPGDQSEKTNNGCIKSSRTSVIGETQRGQFGASPRDMVGSIGAPAPRPMGRDSRASPKLGWVAVSKAEVHSIFDSVVNSMMAEEDHCPTVPCIEILAPKNIDPLTPPSPAFHGSKSDQQEVEPKSPSNVKALSEREVSTDSNKQCGDQSANSAKDAQRNTIINNNKKNDNNENIDIENVDQVVDQAVPSPNSLSKSPESPRSKKAFKWKSSLLERVNEEKEGSIATTATTTTSNNLSTLTSAPVHPAPLKGVKTQDKHAHRTGPTLKSGRRNASSSRKNSSHIAVKTK